MLSLTAVIPVATSIEDLSNLTSNIADALQNDVHVVVVIDRVTNELNSSLEALCVQFLSYGEKFQIVSGKFGAPGKARNAGKQNVNTEFITFWDADDRIEIQTIVNAVSLNGTQYDYIIGSYQVVDLNSGTIRRATSRKLFGKFGVIKEPGIWRMIFRCNAVSNCQFGRSQMGEDQVYLVNSGVLGSERILFTEEVFYTYFIGINGQLTSIRSLNSALAVSIIEIFRSSSRTSVKELVYRLLVVLRIGLTLVKRIVTGKK